MLFNKNKHREGFDNQLLLSNTLSNEITKYSGDKICYYSYDYKNLLEKFAHSKTNNPLSFPNKLHIDVEKVIDFDTLTAIEFVEKHKPIQIKATVSKQEYINQVVKIKEHIQKGDIYELNYCICFEAENAVINPFLFYQKLNNLSNAPYSALAKLNHHWIICSSPELFLLKNNNSLITKPIKGTIRRGASITEDETNKVKLHNNHKERTENVMIVDVCRNDLSRLAKKGTVKVSKLFDIETYDQVHQMVSTIECEINPSTELDSIISSTFPMASMTGAPKIKAMDLADDFEVYNRNAYSGTLGYIKKNGDFKCNVLIRSIFYNEKTKYLSFSVGSAITILSDPEQEYEECLLKANAMIKVLNQEGY